MSKRLARNVESYQNEDRLFAEAVGVVQAAGFHDVAPRKIGLAKFIDAISADGRKVVFWLKLGWSDVPYAAIQFGMFSGVEGSQLSDEEFIQAVNKRTMSIKARGATHALLFHRGVLALALPIDEMPVAYAEQIHRYPAMARNTKSPTMWFFDPRPKSKPELTAIVRQRAIPLDVLAKRSGATPQDPEARSRMGEVELRVAQAAFRTRVGERCGWRCVVTGSAIREALDAAHLPGRDWRTNNDATDGILVRADIHRLLDKGLATVDGGVFRTTEAAREEYGHYDGVRIADL